MGSSHAARRSGGIAVRGTFDLPSGVRRDPRAGDRCVQGQTGDLWGLADLCRRNQRPSQSTQGGCVSEEAEAVAGCRGLTLGLALVGLHENGSRLPAEIGPIWTKLGWNPTLVL